MKTVSTTLSAPGNSPWIVLDRAPAPTSVGVYVEVSGTATYSVEVTPANVGEAGTDDAPGFPVSGLEAQTASTYQGLLVPAGAIRIVAAGGTTGTVTMHVIQAGN